jgi:hypothetical protein
MGSDGIRRTSVPDAADAAGVTSLRRTIRAALGTEVRTIRLPARPEDAERLLDGLAH